MLFRSPKSVALPGIVLTKMQDSALGPIETHTVCLGPLIEPIRSLCSALLPSGRSTLPPSLVLSANLLRVHSIPSSRSLIKMLKRSGPSIEPWGTLLVTGHLLDLTPLTATHWAWPSSQCFTQRSVHPSRPWATSFSTRMLEGTVSKALLKFR